MAFIPKIRVWGYFTSLPRLAFPTVTKNNLASTTSLPSHAQILYRQRPIIALPPSEQKGRPDDFLIMIQSYMPHSRSRNSFLFNRNIPLHLPRRRASYSTTTTITDLTSTPLEPLHLCTQNVCVSPFSALKPASRVIFFLFSTNRREFKRRRSHWRWRSQRSSWRRWWLWQ